MLKINAQLPATQQFKVVSSRPRSSTARPVVRCAAEAAETSTTATPEIAEEPKQSKKSGVYVGKGRYLDESSEYYKIMEKTGRDDSLTGGFAGGEAFLKSWITEVPTTKPKAAEKAKSGEYTSKKTKLYVGKGRYLDESIKTAKVIATTARDNELTGGFAGGERGLRSFVETGEVSFAENPRRQQSPLIIAGLISALGVTGGIFFTDVEELGQKILANKPATDGAAGAAVAAAPMDDETRAALQIGLIILGLLGTVVGGTIVVGGLAKSVREGASKLATFGVFWAVVLLAARFILTN